jgi:pantetheine-phosphate adenylyltransferase
MKRIAIFPGSFDPITAGHYDLVLRARHLFEKIIIAIGSNSEKQGLFSPANRREMIVDLFAGQAGIEVEIYSGLTIDFCRAKNAGYLLRGLRTSADFEFERVIAQANRQLYPDVETVFLLTAPEYSHISSSIVREVLRHGGDPSAFLPAGLKLPQIGS